MTAWEKQGFKNLARHDANRQQQLRKGKGLVKTRTGDKIRAYHPYMYIYM